MPSSPGRCPVTDDSAEASARIELEFASAQEADAVRMALAPEDKGWVVSRVQGARLVAEIRAAKLSEFLRTVDDYLACATAAARSLRAVKSKPS